MRVRACEGVRKGVCACVCEERCMCACSIMVDLGVKIKVA